MRATILARTLEARGAKVPHLLGTGVYNLVPAPLPHPVFQEWPEIWIRSQIFNVGNKFTIISTVRGPTLQADPAYRLPIFNLSMGGSSAFKGHEMPGEREKIRRQHAGRNKDAQSQLRRNSQASIGVGMMKGQHFKMRRVKESSAGKGEL